MADALAQTSALATTTLLAADNTSVGLRIVERAFAPKFRLQSVPETRVATGAGARLELPGQCGGVTGNDPWVLWLGPTEWLAWAAAGDRDSLGARIDASFEAGALLATDLSDALVALELSGARVLDVLAVDCPLDLAGGAVAVGSCANSQFGHVPILLQRRENDWIVFVERPLARFFVDWLRRCAERGG